MSDRRKRIGSGELEGRQTLRELKVQGIPPPSSRPPRAADLSAVLVVLTGPQIGERVELGEQTTIGRDPASSLALRDGGVSWTHCVIRRRDAHYLVQDVGSRHGTQLNGVQLTGEMGLCADDQLVLGQTLLRFELHGPAEQHFDRTVLERLVRDDLTGLLSRRKFEIDLEGLVEHAIREQEPLALVVLDVDGLKAVNDAHGHLVGARVIAETGRTIAKIVPPDASACRLGGDEFAVALPRMDLAAGLAIARAIADAVEAQRLSFEKHRIAVRISAGVASAPQHADDPLELFRIADEALLRAKRKGGGRIESAG